jgi:hypothetical protein
MLEVAATWWLMVNIWYFMGWVFLLEASPKETFLTLIEGNKKVFLRLFGIK